jgi:hypothetical protein
VSFYFVFVFLQPLSRVLENQLRGHGLSDSETFGLTPIMPKKSKKPIPFEDQLRGQRWAKLR